MVGGLLGAYSVSGDRRLLGAAQKAADQVLQLLTVTLLSVTLLTSTPLTITPLTVSVLNITLLIVTPLTVSVLTITLLTVTLIRCYKPLTPTLVYHSGIYPTLFDT